MTINNSLRQQRRIEEQVWFRGYCPYNPITTLAMEFGRLLEEHHTRCASHVYNAVKRRVAFIVCREVVREFPQS